MNRITVLLVDDHRMMRDGLRAVLQREPGIEVVGEAESGREALAMAQQLAPRVVVMDITMPDLNGIDAVRQMLARDPAIRIVALSTHTDPRYVRAMFEAGASAYVVKAAASEELVSAIRAAIGNRKHLSSEVTGPLIDAYLGRGTVPESAQLASREREVLQLVAEGRSSPEIAAVLHISASTVEVHRRNIMKKLGLHSVAALTKYAIREGLTTLDP